MTTTEQKPNLREERLLDTATTLERPHLTSREERLVQIATDLAVEDWMVHKDE
jgi:hypothetical protein